MEIKKMIIVAIILNVAVVSSFARPIFDKKKDILIAQFDSKPDPDDIHAQAALGSMLLHKDLKGVKYYAVAGAVGTQGGKYIDSKELFNMIFGNKWTDAHANWALSVQKITNQVIPILQKGGKVWVQEAGQSNITADWVQEVLKTVAAQVVKSNVLVVQHSNWNEDKTDSTDLAYVKDKTSYFSLDDGNAPTNAEWGDRGPYPTPEYRNKDSKWMELAKSSVNKKASKLWATAEDIIANKFPEGFPEEWSYIHYNGVDYSDCVENWWIFNIGEQANDHTKFWNRYVMQK
ncbi:hypothetical protein [Saccharicrinis fermentans]|uniref:Uncharacterized protein n=1 Tax=Saccharicrinis fermentans DSM 9555 = JCM 21142 TaxID=869213 RepID=W7YEL2_9BACT|nr:hypothetical protein [Saccharicrinis fermentans]GAF02886.1 hypothetical protein JCM21142_41535 [Saccharicrinis fermentans DSM 9555 = JCM 21142]